MNTIPQPDSPVKPFLDVASLAAERGLIDDDETEPCAYLWLVLARKLSRLRGVDPCEFAAAIRDVVTDDDNGGEKRRVA